MWLFSSKHHKFCSLKDKQRTCQFATLKSSHSDPFSDEDFRIQSLYLADIVSSCSSGVVSPSLVRDVYLKRTLAAHEATNCITDFLSHDPQPPKSGTLPLLGVPISIKDCFDIEGHDTTLGYSRNANRPVQTSSVMVKMLIAAGATLHVKTTVPVGLLSLETDSDLYGYTTNPYSENHSSGGSTGGGAALLAYGGSKIEIGSDLGGSVRIPAHFCGIYGLKASSGRFPIAGNVGCFPGLRALSTVTSPMAADLDDLEEFCHRFIDMKPWEQDPTCVPLSWRAFDFIKEHQNLKFGVIWDDGIILPTPPCMRALKTTVDALKQQGHEVIEFRSPSPLKGMALFARILSGAAAAPIEKPRSIGESISSMAREMNFMLATPLWIKRLVAGLIRICSRPRGRNEVLASLLPASHASSVLEERKQALEQEKYMADWLHSWNAEQLDFVLTVPYPTPAVLRRSQMPATTINYTSLYNLLDVTAGVLPVTFVDQEMDALPPNFKHSPEYAQMNQIAQSVYGAYDAKSMHGLPVGVQVVGRRLEEEKVLAGMKVVRGALAATGTVFKPRKF